MAGTEHTITPNSIAAIILAAGGSLRMGRPKQLIEFRGENLTRRAARIAIEARLTPLVVLGCEAVAVENTLADLSVRCVINEEWPRGIGSSLRAGVQAIRRQSSAAAAIVMLCDQPLITADSLRRLVAAHQRTGARIVASRYGGTLGVPALFSGPSLDDLLGLPDVAGAKRVIQQAGASACAVEMPEAAIDLDCEADLARLDDSASAM